MKQSNRTWYTEVQQMLILLFLFLPDNVFFYSSITNVYVCVCVCVESLIPSKDITTKGLSVFLSITLFTYHDDPSLLPLAPMLAIWQKRRKKSRGRGNEGRKKGRKEEGGRDTSREGGEQRKEKNLVVSLEKRKVITIGYEYSIHSEYAIFK